MKLSRNSLKIYFLEKKKIFFFEFWRNSVGGVGGVFLGGVAPLDIFCFLQEDPP